MNRKDRAFIVGTLLGDSSLHQINKKYENFTFQFTHQEKQKEYAFYKASQMCKILKRKHRNPNFYTSHTAYGKVDYYKFTIGHKYFKYLYRVAYPQGKKFFSKKLLNYLTPEGIALWYMDDGGVSRKIQSSGWTTVEMRISIYCSLEEIENIISYFKDKWGIQAKKRFAKKTQSYYLAFSSNESCKLETLIAQFILPSFKYKLPNYYNPRVQDINLIVNDDIVRTIENNNL